MAVKVSVLGHSYVRRLMEVNKPSNQWKNLNLRESEVIVDFLGRGGGTVQTLTSREFSSYLTDKQPDVVVLQIGGNDVDRRGSDSVKIAGSILTIAEWMLCGFGVKQVCVMQLLFRRGTRNIPVDVYNNRVRAVNQVLKARVADRSDIQYHKHRGLKNCVVDIFRPDGFISTGGMESLKRQNATNQKKAGSSRTPLHYKAKNRGTSGG
ncbi:uncharacterized protein LOC110462266 isoform X2 [Mizuhopecten yessoensis]|uniref:uncharacterized protein LOC110462266 isoform X2 n=1 Tax=Mizuhopecten yessoensis TaxID=6573 RepID=UPI000B45733C|nr:uncharacterized protein LOC110462266 isoform X2 [Mizuhopecten yessoensis]XP_021371844.1 uncharacterized protein LOC110462266 isoform X2 [Mizuhopecten yessoensis]